MTRMNEETQKRLARLQKIAYAPPPMDPAAAMGGGMPPGMPMDPAMGGGMPPMDPSMGGGMPPGMPPMDPAMGGGMPPMDPAMGGGMPPMDPAMGGSDMPPIMVTLEDLRTLVEDIVGGAKGEKTPGADKPAEGDRLAALEGNVAQIMNALGIGATGGFPGGGAPGAPAPEAPASNEDVLNEGFALGEKTAAEDESGAAPERSTEEMYKAMLLAENAETRERLHAMKAPGTPSA